VVVRVQVANSFGGGDFVGLTECKSGRAVFSVHLGREGTGVGTGTDYFGFRKRERRDCLSHGRQQDSVGRFRGRFRQGTGAAAAMTWTIENWI